MKQNNYLRYFRVFNNDTTITEIFTNDFIPVTPRPLIKKALNYQLTVNEHFFYGYHTLAKAQEMAKAGALAHINKLIAKGKDGKLALYEYRFHHYEDLNVNLIEASINAPL